MSLVAVVAYGNPLRGDDGAAWLIAERLESQGDGAVVLTLHQLTPEVAVVVSQADGVIFVDAAQDGIPGRVACRELAPAATPGSLTHHVRPEMILALAQQLYGTCPRAALVTVVGESFAVGGELSPSVRQSLPEAERTVRRLIRDWSRGALSEGTAFEPPRSPGA